MVTKKEKQLAIQLLKERIERLTGKKVTFKEPTNRRRASLKESKTDIVSFLKVYCPDYSNNHYNNFENMGREDWDALTGNMEILLDDEEMFYDEFDLSSEEIREFKTLKQSKHWPRFLKLVSS